MLEYGIRFTGFKAVFESEGFELKGILNSGACAGSDLEVIADSGVKRAYPIYRRIGSFELSEGSAVVAWVVEQDAACFLSIAAGAACLLKEASMDSGGLK